MSDSTAGRLRELALQARADRLAWIARAVVGEGLAGAHRSRLRGTGTRFVDHRPYAVGDDLRRVDWRASARSPTVVVKQYEADRAAATALLVDVSRSMEFGTVELSGDAVLASTKSEAAAMAAAILGYRALRSSDRVSVSLVGEEVRRLPRRRGDSQLGALCEDLAMAIPATSAGAAMGQAVAAALASGHRRLVLLTDALDPDHGWIDQLAEARARGHGTAVIQVLDRAEQHLPYDEPSLFVDPEGGHSIRTHPARVRRLYDQLFASFLEQLRRDLQGAGVEHVLLFTGTSVRIALAREGTQ